jgi:hypothetical protein
VHEFIREDVEEGKPMRKLNRNQFERMFGFRPKPSLTAKQRERATQVQQLFEAMENELGMKHRDVFQAYADAQHFEFVHSVLSLPKGIELFCKKALQPQSGMREQLALRRHQNVAKK